MPDLPPTRLVAGLWCADILALLPDYLDASLSAQQRADVEQHLAGCDWCARFGGDYAGTVQAVRDQFTEDPPAGLSDRLLDRLGQDKV